MTVPRCYVPRACYFVTRRTRGGHLLLRPDATCRQLAGYLLAVAAERHGIRLHAVVVMGNHIHLVCSDPGVRLQDFLRDFHRWMALSFKQLRHWDETLWDSRRPSVQMLLRSEAIADKTAYLLANPCSAGLVPHGDRWPGLWGWWADWPEDGETISKPSSIPFLASDRWPPTADLRLVAPEGELLEQLGESSLDQLVSRIRCLYETRRTDACATTRRFPCVLQLLRRHPWGRPSARRIECRRRLGEANPSMAIGSSPANRGLWKAVQRMWKAFLTAYREALRTWSRTGQAEFPLGTVRMRLAPGVTLAPQPPPWLSLMEYL